MCNHESVEDMGMDMAVNGVLGHQTKQGSEMGAYSTTAALGYASKERVSAPAQWGSIGWRHSPQPR